ncbi:MAG: ABC transporter permease subunit [Deltaproteobacteria bacterium]|nr:ABC transporter permease subunit [Deltaproteobacteria bacterium]MBW2394587.1 ABC transporter permease subunit [Deltaproteobacteria bacterium]
MYRNENVSEENTLPTEGGAIPALSREPDAGHAPTPSSGLRHVIALELAESLRARWFLVYALVFPGLVALLFAFTLTESRVLGFMGLSRLLVTYIQVCMAILPIFVLVTTVRSVAGDREAGIFEYLLALPIGLGAWYWGRIIARFGLVFVPVFIALLGAASWGWIQDIPFQASTLAIYSALLLALTACFLGIGMLISVLARSVDAAQGSAFVLWLFLVLFLDLILLGTLIEEHITAETAVAIALANPLQVFRTAAMALFDPDLVLLGPAAFVILDFFGHKGFLAWAVFYPTALGSLCALLGFWRFRNSDLP